MQRLSPYLDKEVEHMNNVSYASAIESSMYVMVCNRPDISHVASMKSAAKTLANSEMNFKIYS